MRLLIVCSTSFYNKIPEIKNKLEKKYELVMPNQYEETLTNEEENNLSEEEYYDTFKDLYYESREKIKNIDAILVLNFTKIKNGIEYKNYIGASTFLEMYETFMQNKKIYMLNGYPDNILYDEIRGFKPIVINGDLGKI